MREEKKMIGGIWVGHHLSSRPKMHALTPFPRSQRTKQLEPGGLSDGKVWASEVICPGCGRHHLDTAVFERVGRTCFICHSPLYAAV